MNTIENWWATLSSRFSHIETNRLTGFIYISLEQGRDALTPLIDSFLASQPDRLDRLRQNKIDSQEQIRIFHNLKSVSRSLGATVLAQMSAALEKQPQDFSKQNQLFFEECEQVTQELKSLKSLWGEKAKTISGRAVEGIKKKRKILCVDDEAMILDVIHQTFGNEYEIHSTTDGHEAIRILRNEGPFSLILCDLVMPGLNGKDLIEAIEKEFPQMTSKLILITGGTFERCLQEFIERKRLPTVHKPFRLKSLRTLMERQIAAEERQSKTILGTDL